MTITSLSKDDYINAFEQIYNFDSIDIANYEHEHLISVIQDNIDDCKFDNQLPSKQEMADIVKEALSFIEYGDTIDVDEMNIIYNDYKNRFPLGR